VAVALVLLIGLAVLAHGALLLATRERSASVLEARLLARRVLALAAARVPDLTDTLPTLGPGARVLTAAGHGPWGWRTDGSALDRELALLIGVGRVRPLPSEARAAVLAWVMDPSVRAATTAAVVELGGAVDRSGGSETADDWLAPPPRWAHACTAELAVLDSLAAGVPPPTTALPGTDREPPGVPRLGLLPGDSALARIPSRVGGAVRPSPEVRLGACLDESQNWGSPGDPSGPCGSRMVLAGADEDLIVEGGEGQGVLIAAGSVTLVATRFYGLVLAGGDLTLAGGARLVGAARVRGDLRLSAGEVVGSACAVARALRGALPLRRPYLLPEGGPITPL
jgi:hypothetical protein